MSLIDDMDKASIAVSGHKLTQTEIDVLQKFESELAQARAIKFPRETKPDNILGGWTISFGYLMRIKKELQNTNEDPVDLETIESVLLSVELAASNTEKDGE